MQKEFLKFSKFFANIAFPPLILMSNNAELSASYLINDVEQTIKNLEINNYSNGFFQDLDIEQERNILFAENEKNDVQEKVLISEIIIEGWENHPEGRKLELAAYDAMSIKPGSIIDNQTLSNDLNSIYASGWFSGVKIKSQDGPLGARLIVNVVPNPILKKVELKPNNSLISDEEVDDIFNNFYGTTLNLNELQNKIEIIKKRYESEGYSLARINGPERISDTGLITLNVSEGIISDVKLRFPGSDGESIIDGKPRKGKTKDWVIKRELKTQPGTIFNRKILEVVRQPGGGRRGARGRRADRLAHAVPVAAVRDAAAARRGVHARRPADGRLLLQAAPRAVQPVAEARVLEDAEGGVDCDPGALPAAVPRPRVGDDPRDAAQGHARLHLRARARRPRHRRLRRDRRDVRAARVGGEAAADEHHVPSDGDALALDVVGRAGRAPPPRLPRRPRRPAIRRRRP